jgi:hypothetical protein
MSTTGKAPDDERCEDTRGSGRKGGSKSAAALPAKLTRSLSNDVFEFQQGRHQVAQKAVR